MTASVTETLSFWLGDSDLETGMVIPIIRAQLASNATVTLVSCLFGV
jgi:hypothetical protein